MGWGTTAPTLPAGSSWKSVGSVKSTQNKYEAQVSIAIARLATNQVAIRFILNTYNGETSTFKPPDYMDFQVGSSIQSYNWGVNLPYVTSKTAYWTGTLAAGSTVKVYAGGHDSGGSAFSHATYIGKTATGPDYVTKYTITYKANGSGQADQAQSKTYGSAVSLFQNPFTYSGYGFLGWNTSADGSGTAYAAGASYSGNSDLTLYAQWRRLNIPVFVNVGGTVRQVEKAYANIGGVIKECDVYANVAGTIKLIK
jgi:hypothetical protein